MSLLVTGLKLVPRNALSRAAGAVLGAPWPRPLVRAAIRGFSRAYRVDVGEAEREVGAYPTFTDFFTRRLKPGARPLPAEPDVACSPCDGTLGECGEIRDGTLLQAKGRSYALRELLADDADAAAFDGGTYATVYLSPRNYHRVHFPLGGEVTGWTHVPGHLWPVNARGVAEIDRLFAVNERLVTHLASDAGRVAVVMVGATVVGRIRACYADVVTNERRHRELRRGELRPPVRVARGDECGVFELGSTAVVLFQAGRAALLPGLGAGAPVRFGQPLARVSRAPGEAGGEARAG